MWTLGGDVGHTAWTGDLLAPEEVSLHRRELRHTVPAPPPSWVLGWPRASKCQGSVWESSPARGGPEQGEPGAVLEPGDRSPPGVLWAERKPESVPGAHGDVSLWRS